MDLDTVSVDYFRTVCESSGLHCQETEKVRDRVYRTTIRTADGEQQEVYGKVYGNDKADIIRELAEDSTAIGLPKSWVISDDVLILLLESAEGKPLSYVLPVFFLPGVWDTWGNRIESAYSHLGWYLGTQHGKTASEPVELLNQAKRSEFRRRTALVKDDVSELTDTRIDELLYEAQERTVPQAVTHSDPSPHNIFYRAGEVTLIDNSFSRKAAAQDHANALLGSWLMVDRLYYPDECIGHQIEKAYWRGYRSRGIESSADRITVGILMLRKYLSLAEYYENNPETLHARMTQHADRPAIVRGIRRKLREIVEAGVFEG